MALSRITEAVASFTDLTIGDDLTLTDDLLLASDANIIKFGADAEVTLTHVHNTGLLLNSTSVIQFNDAAESIHSDGSKLILTSNSVAFSLPTADGSSGQTLQTNGSGVLSFATASANTPSSADGQALGTASLEWSDLFLADGGTIQFGNDQDIILTHVADTGLLLNGTSQLQFNDASQNIGAPNATTLDINADAEIELNATLIDVNGNLDVSGTTLAFTGTPANGEVIYVVHQAGALQTIKAGSDHGARDFNITGDANKITFGIDKEITVTHVADSGLAFKNTNTTDDKPFTLVLQTGETDIAASDKLGVINFQAPDEGTGTDAILVAAGIEAVSEGDFSSSSNATKLSFKTASSAAATEKMSLSSGGNLTVTGDVAIGGNLDVTGTVSFSEQNVTDVGILSLDTIAGDADSNTSIAFSGSDVITIQTGGTTAMTIDASQNTTLGGTLTAVTSIGIGSAVLTEAEMEMLDGITAGTAAANKAVVLDGSKNIATIGPIGSGAITSSGTIQGTTITATTAFVPDASDGAALGTSSLEFSDLFLADGAVINFGADQDINITHVADTGLTTNADFTIGDDLFVSGGLIDLKTNSGSVATIKFYCESGNAHAQSLVAAPHSEAASNTLTLPGTGGNARLVSTSSTATLTNKTLTTPVIAEITSGSTITLNATTDIVLDADGANVIFKDNGTSILDIANNSSDVELTVSVADKNFKVKGTDGSSAITALDIDMALVGQATFSGAVIASGAITGGGLLTTGGNIVIPDAGNIGSASDTNAIGISSGGVVSITATTANTSASDGALTVAGGAGIAADLSVGDDLRLISDGAILSFGADGDITVTHSADTGLATNGTFTATSLIATTSFLPDANAGADIGTTSLGFGDVFIADDKKIQFGNDQDATIEYDEDGTDKLSIAGAQVVFGKSVLGSTQTANATGNTALDFATYQNFLLTATGNVTLTNPSTETVGQSGFIVIKQDGTGSRTLSIGTQYVTVGDAAYALSTAANAIDLIPYVVQADGVILLGNPSLAFA